MSARKDKRCAFDAAVETHLRSLLPPIVPFSALRGLVFCDFSYGEDGTLLDHHADNWPDNEAYTIELRADCTEGVVSNVRIEFVYSPAVLPALQDVIELAKKLDGLDLHFGVVPYSPDDETTTRPGTHGDQLTAKTALRS